LTFIDTNILIDVASGNPLGRISSIFSADRHFLA